MLSSVKNFFSSKPEVPQPISKSGGVEKPTLQNCAVNTVSQSYRLTDTVISHNDMIVDTMIDGNIVEDNSSSY